LRLAPPGSQAYQQAATQTQEILAAQVPVIPLYVRPRLVASVKEVCGLQVDATASTVLWNLAEIHPGPDCGN
jgi:ABC-type transport system substrate-binding protein